MGVVEIGVVLLCVFGCLVCVIDVVVGFDLLEVGVGCGFVVC